MEPTTEWYAIRVTYCREMKLKGYLDSENINSFIPMQLKEVVKNGVKVKKLLPVIHNLIFIQSHRKQLDTIKMSLEQTIPIRYIMDKGTKSPIVVPEQAMQNFIAVSGTYDEQLIYLNKVDPSMKRGENVRITGGIFCGVEGRVVRIQRNKRVLVAIEGIVAVATAYIHPLLLEKI